MKKFLTVFLVALALFSFVGCDTSPKVPSEAEMTEIITGYSLAGYVMYQIADKNQYTETEDGYTRTLISDVSVNPAENISFTLKKGSMFTGDDERETCELEYTLNKENHSLILVITGDSENYIFEKCEYDGTSYDIETFLKNNPDWMESIT